MVTFTLWTRSGVYPVWFILGSHLPYDSHVVTLPFGLFVPHICPARIYPSHSSRFGHSTDLCRALPGTDSSLPLHTGSSTLPHGSYIARLQLHIHTAFAVGYGYYVVRLHCILVTVPRLVHGLYLRHLRFPRTFPALRTFARYPHTHCQHAFTLDCVYIAGLPLFYVDVCCLRLPPFTFGWFVRFAPYILPFAVWTFTHTLPVAVDGCGLFTAPAYVAHPPLTHGLNVVTVVTFTARFPTPCYILPSIAFTHLHTYTQLHLTCTFPVLVVFGYIYLPVVTHFPFDLTHPHLHICPCPHGLFDSHTFGYAPTHTARP